MKRILAFIIVACLAVFVFIPVGNQSVSAAETSVFDREDNEIILYLKISYRRTQETGVFSGGKGRSRLYCRAVCRGGTCRRKTNDV